MAAYADAACVLVAIGDAEPAAEIEPVEPMAAGRAAASVQLGERRVKRASKARRDRELRADMDGDADGRMPGSAAGRA